MAASGLSGVVEMTLTYRDDGTQPLDEDDNSDIIEWHYWRVDPKDWSHNRPLCAEGVPTDDWAKDRPKPIGITTKPDDVTCKNCLEWMHA